MKMKFIFMLALISLVMNPISAQVNIAYGANKEAGQFITIHGVKHYYEVYGEGQPIVLIHGNGTGISGWGAQIAFFSKKYKVYALDNRGRGKSDLGKDSLTYMQQTEDVAEFIKLMKIENAFIIGKSDGGIIGLLLGIYYPEHISKIVAFGANLTPDTNALFPSLVEEQTATRMKAERNLALGDTSQNWYLMVQKLRMMEFQPHITATDLQRIKIPVLVMSCDRDLIKEEHSMYIYKNIPNANLCILPGETHHIARQNPDLFNATVERYLSRPYRNNSYRFNAP